MSDHRNVNAHQPAGKAGGVSGGYNIDLKSFSKRLKALYSHWEQHKSNLWGGADVLSLVTPPTSDELRYLKSSALNVWLIGYEFPETIMVFSKKQIHFLCTLKKISLLESVKKSAKEAAGVDVVSHVKAKGDDGSDKMDSILRSIRGDGNAVGYLAKEVPEGKLLETWAAKLQSSNMQLVDITSGLSDLFAVKGADEIINIKRAAMLSASVMKNFVVIKLENIIDEEKKVTHSALMDDTEKVVMDPMKVKLNLKTENVDICYPPIFQSGGKYDLRPSATSNDDHLYYESESVIICAVGARYKNYCSNVARTYLIDATSTQSKAYGVLLRAHQAAIGAMKPGCHASDVYKAARKVVERDATEFVGNMTKTAGTGIGLEFRESGLSLNGTNERVLKPGMTFNVVLGFNNLETQTTNPKNKNFSLLLADTVIVNEKGPEVATRDSSKDMSDVAYSFNEDDDDDEVPKVKSESNRNEAFPTKASLRSDHGEINKEELRRQHQAQLAHRKNEETARRLAGESSGSGENRSSSRLSSELIAYKSVSDLPPPRGQMMIQIDQKNEAILLPIYGSMVPFHVAMIKTVNSQSDTNRNSYMRIQFNVPGTPFTPLDAAALKHQSSIFIKEVSFRSKDSRHINEMVGQIKILRRQVSARESERAERATLVTQEKLVLAGNRFKPLRISDLWIRPVFGGRGRKLPGTLEAHVNGFRYSTSRADERVDILFRNVKHAFFQPSENEMLTLLHFHLHNHIMVGNKKTKDVQFYVEVMEVVQTLGGGRRSAYDPDEIEEEQRERERKNKVNMDFQSFVNRVNDLWGQPQFKDLDLEFDQPIRELGFHGVPHKTTAFVVPTSSCLVELIETPFVVITLGEIEIVNLERVGFGQKNFDMTIVFKDFKRDVFRIDSIPTSSLEGIKDWLDTTDIKYYESRLNLNWRPILKTITEDPPKFIEDGGWEFLNMDASDSESDGSEESDKGYVPSDEEAESESEDDDSGSEPLVDTEEDEDEDGSEEDSEEEKGKTWEELEREASNADRERGDESDSEEERRRKKMKAFGKSRQGSGGSGGPKRAKLR